jgi:general secretion pathway protein E
VTRLIDMGVERYLLAPMVVGLAAQRLVRKLCPSCRREDVAARRIRCCSAARSRPARNSGAPWAAPNAMRKAIAAAPACTKSSRWTTGFQKMIHDGASEAELEAQARKDNPSLLDDGLAKVRAGVTTVEEVARVVRDEA